MKRLHYKTTDASHLPQSSWLLFYYICWCLRRVLKVFWLTELLSTFPAAQTLILDSSSVSRFFTIQCRTVKVTNRCVVLVWQSSVQASVTHKLLYFLCPSFNFYSSKILVTMSSLKLLFIFPAAIIYNLIFKQLMFIYRK